MAKHDDPKKDDAPPPPVAETRDNPAPDPEPSLDPFATFTEWASEEDTVGYANL